MARYIDLEILERRIKKYVKPEIPEEKAFVEWCKDECIRQAYAMPTADVVPKSEYDAVVSAVDNSTKEFLKLHDAYQNAKAEVERLEGELIVECTRRENAVNAYHDTNSEVERLTINMNAYGLTAKRLAEENESLEIELENMRRNLGDAREAWNDAECEAERLRKALDEYEETSGLKQAKAEVAREIFAEIEKWLIYEYVPYIRGYSNSLSRNFDELKKKYTKENTENENQN